MITSNASNGRLVFCFSLIVVIAQACGFTSRSRAERNVTDYMISRSDDYVPKEFGDFFEQYQTVDIEQAMHTRQQVKYSLVHTYLSRGKRYEQVYFHLDNDLKVIGALTKQEMMEIVMKDLQPKLDEMMRPDLPE